MTNTEALEILEQYQAWRRGADTEMLEPKDIGKAIDIAINALKCTQWRPIETMPNDGGTYLIADAVRGMVAPHIRNVIHNNPGTEHDWEYGEAATHWMPLPTAP